MRPSNQRQQVLHQHVAGTLCDHPTNDSKYYTSVLLGRYATIQPTTASIRPACCWDVMRPSNQRQQVLHQRVARTLCEHPSNDSKYYTSMLLGRYASIQPTTASITPACCWDVMRASNQQQQVLHQHVAGTLCEHPTNNNKYYTSMLLGR